MEKKKDTVFTYILAEETAFKVQKVPVSNGWQWSFYEHIWRSTLMKNSQYEGGNLGDRPFKNITRPILNVAYRAEGVDVKDIVPYVSNPDLYYKSFLARQFNEIFARKYGIDSYIDDLVEHYVDYGVSLSKNVPGKCPELVPAQRLAFCDMTDILGGPLCEKHAYGIDQLLDMVSQGWSKSGVETVILKSRSEKTNDQTQGAEKQKTPGKYIEVYELHGVLPKRYLDPDDTSGEYVRQMHVVCYYKEDNSDDNIGISLYKGLEKPGLYKKIVRDAIYGRCAGFGGIEELFEPQVWINYNAIQIKEMLDIASMIILQTEDKTFKTKNNVSAMVKGQIVVHEQGQPVTRLDMSPVNMEMFNNSTAEFLDLARTTGSANDAVLGESPSAGTPFKLQELVTQEGHGLHDWRQGKIAFHVGEIYRDWILPSIVEEMNDGQVFLQTISLDEMNELADAVATNIVNKKIKEKILTEGPVSPEAQQALIAQEKQKFMGGGGKRFHEILMNEFKSIPMDVLVNVASKQKNLNALSDKLTNVFRQIISNPEVLKNPAIAKVFNQILESAGLDPMDFASLTKSVPSPQQTSTPPNSQGPQIPATAIPATAPAGASS